jgi:thymidine kinase
MFSGKTTYVVHKAQNASEVFKVLVINHFLDTRNEAEVLSTHNKSLNVKGKYDIMYSDNVMKLSDEYLEPYEMIIIDEAQFFSNNREVAERLVDKMKKIVIFAGLNGTYERKNFSGSDFHKLLPLADDVVFLRNAWCSRCFNNGKKREIGIFTHKITGDHNEIVIGEDQYIPLCRECFNSVND